MEDSDKELLAALRYIIDTSELPFERRTDNLGIEHCPGYADRHNPLRRYFPMRRLLTDDIPRACPTRSKFRGQRRDVFRRYRSRFWREIVDLQRARLEEGSVNLMAAYVERAKLVRLFARMQGCLMLHWLDYEQPELSVRWCFEEIEKLLAIPRTVVAINGIG